jgi:streptomycin 6-kinase
MHEGLAWLRRSEPGRAWLESLPGLLEDCARQWSLRLGDAFPYAFASLALEATTSEGMEAVLKIQFPDRESEFEAEALSCWAGKGAVYLLARDSERRALLLERCKPGTPLSHLDQDKALDVMVEMLPRLWIPATAPFRSLTDEARWWSNYLPEKWNGAGKPFEPRLLHAALDVLETLPPSQGNQVLLHQDLHAGNVLRAEREPWLVIDPKPLVGEREFGIAAMVRGGELGDGPDFVSHRLHRLTVELGLDRERARAWTLAQTLAWAFDDAEVLPDLVECARWLLHGR